MIEREIWRGDVMARILKILLLGGTSEGAELNRILSACDSVDIITSLAGATKSPGTLAGEVVRGGFGGIKGLDMFIKARNIEMIIDATHPYADKISHNSVAAAQMHDIPHLRLVRPSWKPEKGDHWIYAANMKKAADNLKGWTRPFLAIGRKDLDAFVQLPDKHFLVRSIEKADFKPSRSVSSFIAAKGPFEKAGEVELMKKHDIDVLVTKNSGGAETYAKIAAARELHLPVVIVERPAEPSGHQYETIDELLNGIDAWR